MTSPENKDTNDLQNEDLKKTSSIQDESSLNQDELLIELDDSAEQAAFADDEIIGEEDLPEVERVQEKTSAKAATPKVPAKKPVKKSVSPKKVNPPKEPRVKGEKKSNKLAISLIIIVLIGGGFAYMYTAQSALLVSWFPFLDSKESSEDLDKIADENIRFDDAVVLEDEENFENDEEIEDEYVYEEVTETEIIDEITEALVRQPKTHSAPKNVVQFETPSWIISYASVSQNNNAIAGVKKLRELGNSAGYYWMPDYTSGAPAMYKVYIGPFASKAQAQSHLASIHELEPQAYVLYVEGK